MRRSARSTTSSNLPASMIFSTVYARRIENMETPFIDTIKLRVIERLPGWRGRYFDSPSMTFAHYEFDAGSSIHEHFHPQEEVYEIVEGELEITIDGVTQRATPGKVAIIPPNTPHSVKAISNGKLIVVDYPLRDVSSAHPNPR